MYPPSTQHLYAAGSTRALLHTGSFRWVAFFAAHVPLALVMNQIPEVATLHAVATLVVGLWYAMLGNRPHMVAFVGAYITGAEVLWRMTEAGVFWEFGKYATIAIFIVAALRFRHLKGSSLPLVYFVLLLPSALLTLFDLGLQGARDQISFNLSGPLALAVSAWFFSRLNLSGKQMQTLFLALIAPVLGIASVVLFSTLTAKTIHFTDESNFATSGGFGPNQVSNVLGLAALLAFVYVLRERRSAGLRVLMFGGIMVFGALSALTFSRSGLYNAGAAALALLIYAVRDLRSLVRLILLAFVLFLVADNLIIPGLDAFTGGALSARFQDVSLTGRDKIAGADLQIWVDNPIFGVGPGMAKDSRDLLIGPVAAHTELTRLLAEHGIFGLAALLLLLGMSIRNIKQAHTLRDKGLAAALILWAFLFMLNSSMRLVAPAFIFGLTFARLLPEDGREPVEHLTARSGASL